MARPRTFHRSELQSRAVLVIPSLATVLTASVVVLSVVLGGGTQQDISSDALVQLSSLALVAYVALTHTPGTDRRRETLIWILVLAVVALPALQLIPLSACVSQGTLCDCNALIKQPVTYLRILST